jgi:hypothetical protein
MDAASLAAATRATAPSTDAHVAKTLENLAVAPLNSPPTKATPEKRQAGRTPVVRTVARLPDPLTMAADEKPKKKKARRKSRDQFEQERLAAAPLPPDKKVRTSERSEGRRKREVVR